MSAEMKPDGRESRRRARRLEVALCLALALGTLATFSQVAGNGFVAVDDELYLLRNPAVQQGFTRESVAWALTSAYASNWHPLTWLSLILDWQLYGNRPLGYHLTNLALHTVTALLLFVFLQRSTQSPWRSAFAAALFAVHPLRVESVAWVAERKDVLSTCLMLLAIHAYAGHARRPTPARYAAIVVLYALGLMSKPMLVSLPILLLLLDFWPLARLENSGVQSSGGGSPALAARALPRSFRELLVEKLPLIALAGASCAATLWAQSGSALASLDALPFEERLAGAPLSTLWYLRKMFWPSGLAVFYPRDASMPPAWQWIGALALLASITAWSLRVRRRHPYLVVGWLWFLAALIPVIGIVKAGLQDTADRYAYVPSIGLTVALAWTAPDLLKPWQARAKAFLLWGSSIAVLSVMAGLCARQVSYWRDTDTLFRHALRVTRDNYFAETHLAVDLLRQKRDELVPEAVARLQRAVELAPHFREAHSNLAIALYLNQDYAGAWREVHWLRRHGGPLAPEFVAMLAQRMPEPKS